jgi:hypothetical protein
MRNEAKNEAENRRILFINKDLLCWRALLS